MAFLTMIAPLIAFTYPIDKIKDGTAQAFNKWLIEYLFNAILQPLHLLIYVVLVGTATNLITINPLYALVALAFISQAEKLMKDMFGLNKASTPPSPGAAMATGALASQAFNKIRGAGGSAANALGSGKSGGGSGGTEKTKIRQQSKGLEAYTGSNDNEGKLAGKANTATINSDDKAPLKEESGPWQKTNMSKEEYQEKFGDSVPWRLNEENNNKGDSQPKQIDNPNSNTEQIKSNNYEKPKKQIIKAPRNAKQYGVAASIARTGASMLGKGVRFTAKNGVKLSAMAAGAVVGGALWAATGKSSYLVGGIAAGKVLGNKATRLPSAAVNAGRNIRNATVGQVKNTYRQQRLGTQGAQALKTFEEFKEDKENLEYVREKFNLKNDRAAKKMIEQDGAEFIKSGYTNVEDVSRLMQMKQDMNGQATADQIMAADQMASKVKYDDLMDEGKSKKLEATIANQIQTTAAQKGKSMTKEEAEKHAQKHMNLMRAAHGIPSISEKAQTRQENPQEKTEQKTPTKTPSKNKNGKNKGKAKHEKNAKSAQRKAKRKASNKQKKG